jgi:hypothetical protein
MKQPPPTTVSEFLEGLGVRWAWTTRGKLVPLLPAHARWLMRHVRRALPAIEMELERRRLLSKRSTSAAAGELPAPGPRLNQVRVTNFFRGMNRVEVFTGPADWIELGWASRQRDGRKIAAQKLLALAAEPHPRASKTRSESGATNAAIPTRTLFSTE